MLVKFYFLDSSLCQYMLFIHHIQFRSESNITTSSSSSSLGNSTRPMLTKLLQNWPILSRKSTTISTLTVTSQNSATPIRRHWPISPNLSLVLIEQGRLSPLNAFIQKHSIYLIWSASQKWRINYQPKASIISQKITPPRRCYFFIYFCRSSGFIFSIA